VKHCIFAWISSWMIYNNFLQLQCIQALECQWHLYEGYHKKIKLFWDSEVEKCSHMYYDLCVRTLQSAWFKFISLVVLTLIINNFAYTVASVQDEIKLHYKFRTSYYKEWVTKVAFWYTQWVIWNIA